MNQYQPPQRLIEIPLAIMAALNAAALPQLLLNLKPPPTNPSRKIAREQKRDGWDYTKFFAELIGLGFLIAYTIYTAGIYRANKKASDAATSAANTAARQLELAERPWVDADISLDGPLSFNVNGGNLPLKVLLRNTGHSPAKNTAIGTAPMIGEQSTNSMDYRQKACKMADSVMQQIGVSLFPDVRFGQDHNITFGKDDLENLKASKRFPGSAFPDNTVLSLGAAVCIAYRPMFQDASIYHTAYVIDLFKRDSTTNQPVVIFKIGEDVKQERLILRMSVFNAIEAN